MIFNNVPFVQESMRKLFAIITALVTGGLTVATLLGSQSISAVSAAAALKVRTNLPPFFFTSLLTHTLCLVPEHQRQVKSVKTIIMTSCFLIQ